MKRAKSMYASAMLFTTCLFAIPASFGMAQNLARVPKFVAPKLKQLPQVDGRVTHGEWDGAATLTGFSVLSEGMLATVPTTVHIGYTDDALFIAFVCECNAPPHAKVRPRDSKVWEDEAVEVFIDVGRTMSRHYQFIVNALGSVWDSIGEEPSWDGKWVVRTHIEGNRWTAELRIPFSTLVAKPRTGDVWGINFARDARSGVIELSSFAPVAHSFHETHRFAMMIFGNVGDGIRIERLRFDEAKGILTAQFHSGAKWHVRSSDKRVKIALTSEALRASGIPTGTTTFTFIAQNAPGKEALRMSVSVKKRPSVEVELIRRFLTANALDVRVKVQKWVKDAHRCEIMLVDERGATVRRVHGAIGRDGTARVTISVKKLKPADYKVRVRITDARGSEVASASQKVTIPSRPKWLGSKAGITDEVLPPWTPVRAKRNVAVVWGRRYEFAGCGLPARITTRERQILAHPIIWQFVMDGKTVTPRGRLHLVERRDNTAVFESLARARDIEIATRVTVEYDGMMRFDVTFKPMRRVRVEKLELVIPLKRAHAKYLHHWPGWWGACKNSFALKRSWRFTFRPLVFIADEERGLCWFTETDEPFDLHNTDATLDVTVGDEVAVFRVRLLDHPTEWDDAWSWTFGLQATPVKPVPVAWWLKERIAHWGHYGMESRPAPQMASAHLVYPAEGNIDVMRGTLEAWVRPEFDPWAPEIDKVPLGKRGAYNRDFFIMRLRNRDIVAFYWNADDHGMRFYARIGGKHPIIIGARAPTMRKGKWSHIALTWGDEIRIYVDGKLTCKRKWRGLFGKPVDVGGAELIFGGTQCEFTVDELRISHIARTEFDMTKQPVADDSTLLIDHLDAEFKPDGVTPTKPARGKGGVPSEQASFVDGKFGRALALFAPQPVGWKKLTYLDAAKMLGVRTIVFHEHWTDIQNYRDTTHEKELRSLVNALHKRGMRLAVYFGYEISDIAPEYEHYARECLCWKPGMWFYTRRPPQKAYRVCYNSPWADFVADGIRNVLEKYGIDGVYLDGTASPWGCDNELHGCGYIGKDGKRHATYPFFAVRALMKRIYALCYKRHPDEPFVNVHNSTGLYVPTLAFATSFWDGEQFAGVKRNGKHPLEILPLDAFRCEFMGHNVGIPADFLVYVGRPFTYEEGLAMALIHDVMPRPPHPGSHGANLAGRIWKLFGEFGADRSTWMPYWRNEIVRVRPKGVYASCYVRKGRGMLIVVANLGRRTVNVTLELNRTALRRFKLATSPVMREVLRGVKIKTNGNTAKFELPPFKVHVLHVGK